MSARWARATGTRHHQADADQFGHGVESVRLWVRQADIDDGRQPGLTTDETARFASSSRRSANSAGRRREQALVVVREDHTLSARRAG